MNDLIPLSQACDMLAVSESTLRRMVHDGKLTRYKISRRVVRYSAREIQHLINKSGYRNSF